MSLVSANCVSFAIWAPWLTWLSLFRSTSGRYSHRKLEFCTPDDYLREIETVCVWGLKISWHYPTFYTITPSKRIVWVYQELCCSLVKGSQRIWYISFFYKKAYKIENFNCNVLWTFIFLNIHIFFLKFVSCSLATSLVPVSAH